MDTSMVSNESIANDSDEPIEVVQVLEEPQVTQDDISMTQPDSEFTAEGSSSPMPRRSGRPPNKVCSPCVRLKLKY